MRSPKLSEGDHIIHHVNGLEGSDFDSGNGYPHKGQQDVPNLRSTRGDAGQWSRRNGEGETNQTKNHSRKRVQVGLDDGG